jgi:ABC-type dipeptide/oligopeptide/nickel transport system permease component
VLERDQPVLLALVTLAAVATWAGLLLSDVLAGMVDPRTRTGERP